MYLHLAKACMRRLECKGAIRLLERIQAPLPPHPSRSFLVVSLVCSLMRMLQSIDIAHRLTDIRLEI